MKPKSDLSLSEWADDKRYIAEGTSPEPGRWNTSRVPYMREPMDAVTNGDHNEIVLMGGSQWGKSEFLLNIMGYFIDEDPDSILFIQPSKEASEAFSEERFTPMVEATPCLSSKISSNKSRDGKNTTNSKSYPGGHLAFVGANVPQDVSGRPRRVVLGDEIDRWPVSAGKDGDVLYLARQRTVNYWNKIIINVSTPVDLDTSRINQLWEESDKRLRHYTCPDCDHSHDLVWENVKWDGDDVDTSPETALYHCPGCGVGWSDVVRWRLGKTGKWIKQNPSSKLAGFHLSQLYSPWIKLSSLVRDFITAQGKPLREKVFHNTVLGLPYDEKVGADVEVSELLGRVENIPKFTMPERSALLTAGVDVQGDRLEMQIIAWGMNDESWVLDKFKIFGDPQNGTVWKDLAEKIKTFSYKHPLVEKRFKIEVTAIDSGHKAQRVYIFSRMMLRQGYRVYAIKGQAGEGRLIWKESKKKNSTTQVFIVGVDDAKSTIYGRLATTEGEGCIHFSDRCDKEYFQELIVEKIVLKTNKLGLAYREWFTPSGARNEAFDTMVYAMAAKESRNIDIEARLRAMAQPKQEFDFVAAGKALNG